MNGAGCGEPMTKLIDLLGYAAYFELNRTRPASVRKDMHTGRVFCFQALVAKHWRA
jgi:hypothetical protein